MQHQPFGKIDRGSALIRSFLSNQLNTLGYQNVVSALGLTEENPPDCGSTNFFNEVTINSHFQPIYSLSHRRIVGHEALMRGQKSSGEPISPLVLLEQANQDYATLFYLDHLALANHFRHFSAQPDSDDWLFINMSPEVFLRGPQVRSGQLVLDLMKVTGLEPHRLIIEVLEDSVQDSSRFCEAVEYFRRFGFLIALDDFGAGHSNFDRVWSIRPDIVKLDRSLITQAAKDPKIRRSLPQITSLLHQVGTLVLLEGIETAEEAYIALESDVDFVQGYHFGRPDKNLSNDNCEAIHDLWDTYDARWLKDKQDYHKEISPYLNALGYASALLSAGRSMEEACRSFLELENAAFCYQLDAQGQQIGINIRSSNSTPQNNTRFAPLADASSARWSRRPYFRRAVESFGKVQVTRPYLSISTASLCVTFSCSFKVNNELRVICGDVNWEGH